MFIFFKCTNPICVFIEENKYGAVLGKSVFVFCFLVCACVSVHPFPAEHVCLCFSEESRAVQKPINPCFLSGLNVNAPDSPASIHRTRPFSQPVLGSTEHLVGRPAWTFSPPPEACLGFLFSGLSSTQRTTSPFGRPTPLSFGCAAI